MLYSLIAFILCTTIMCESKLEPISEEQINRRLHLKECVVEASKRFFSSNSETITYCLPLEESQESNLAPVVLDRYLLPGLTQDTRINYLIKNLSKPNFDMGQARKSNVYIIQIRKQEDVSENLQKLKQLSSWNLRAKFLVISPTVFEQPHEVAQEVFKVLWEIKVVTAAILLPNNDTYYSAYTWHPYRDGNCGNNFIKAYVLSTCSFGIIQSNTSWFKTEFPKQFNRCAVKVHYFNRPPYAYESVNSSSNSNSAIGGIEVNLVDMIADILNLTITYERGEIGMELQKDNECGDFKLLENKTIDLVIGGLTSSSIFHISPSYIQESLIWCVPHIPIIRHLENIINIFNIEAWILILSTYFIMSFVVWYSSYYAENESTSYKSLVNCLQNIFAMTIGSPPDMLPRSTRLRFLTVMFIICSYNIESFYTSYLTSILSSPSYEEEYTSVEDIYKSDLKTYFLPDDTRYFESRGRKDSKALFLEEVKRRWLNCSDVQKCLEHVALRKDSTFLLPKLHKDYVLNNGTLGKLNCLKEVMLVFPINMIVCKGFPLFQRFDDTLYRIISSGFIAKWEKEVLNDKYRKSPIDFITFDTVSIKFKHLQPVFNLFLISHVLCLVVFIIEILYNKRKCRNIDANKLDL